MVGFREHSKKHIRERIIKGNKLVDPDTNRYGIRHLFTAQISEPFFLPSSPAMNRQTDYVIEASMLIPCIFLFFAIPKMTFSLTFDFIQHIDNMVTTPSGGFEKFEASGIFEFDKHIVLWMVYRTKNMIWPSQPYIIFFDGYYVPVVIGVGNKQYKLLLVAPTYVLEGNNLHIRIQTVPE